MNLEDEIEEDHAQMGILVENLTVSNAQLENQLADLTARLRQTEERDLMRGNILGRIACELFPGHDNVTDEQCVMGVKALALELANLKRAGEQFDADLVQLLSQCQEGRMTCIYAAQVIEGKMQERLRQTEAERDEARKKASERIAILEWQDGPVDGRGRPS